MPAADKVEVIGRSTIGPDGTEPASGLAVSHVQPHLAASSALLLTMDLSENQPNSTGA